MERVLVGVSQKQTLVLDRIQVQLFGRLSHEESGSRGTVRGGREAASAQWITEQVTTLGSWAQSPWGLRKRVQSPLWS